jgi:hypothetical protein
MERVPIRVVNPEDASDNARSEQIEKLIAVMLVLHDLSSSPKSWPEQSEN